MLQGAWRSKVARRNIMEMVKGAWQKFEDKTTKKCYYLNTNTGRVTWEKPHLLGAEDLPISRGIRLDARRTVEVVAITRWAERVARHVEDGHRGADLHEAAYLPVSLTKTTHFLFSNCLFQLS